MQKQWLVMAVCCLTLGVFGVALPVVIAVSECTHHPSEFIPLQFTVSPLWKPYGTDPDITTGGPTLLRTYVSGTDTVHLAIAYDGNQDGQEMVNSENKKRYRGDGIVLSEGTDTVRVNAMPCVVDANDFRLRSLKIQTSISKKVAKLKQCSTSF